MFWRLTVSFHCLHLALRASKKLSKHCNLHPKELRREADNTTCTFYYMASTVSRRDESNSALWLATQVGKMALSGPLGTTHKKNFRKPHCDSFIDQACSVKMAWYWPHSFFVSSWTSTLSQSINMQTKKLTNVQSSWPHTRSITPYLLWPATISLAVNVSFFGCIFLGELHTAAKISDSSQ